MNNTASATYGLRTIAVMTSWPPRIRNVYAVIKSVFSGNIVPDAMLLTLAEDEFPKKEADLPKDLKTAIGEHLVTILWEPKNTYTFKKLIPPARILRGEQNTLIWTVDDDFLYHKDTLSEMLKSYIAHPGRIISGSIGGGACRLIREGDIPDQMLKDVPDDICATRLDDAWVDGFMQLAGVEEIACAKFDGKEENYGDKLPGAHPASEVYLNGLHEKENLIRQYISDKYTKLFTVTHKMKITMLTVGFNHPNLTDHLLTSLESVGYDLRNDLHFILADNSSIGDGEIWTAKAHNVDYVDGRMNRIGFPVDTSETWGSTSHQSMLQFCIDHIVPKDTDYLVIADCDTYIKQKFDSIISKMHRYGYITAGIRSVDQENPRIHPCFQIIDFRHMKKTGIQYAGKLDIGKWDTGTEYYGKVKNHALLLYPDIRGGKIDCPLFTHYDSGTHGGTSRKLDTDIPITQCTDYSDLTFFTVNFGTQMLTEAAITSFLARHPKFAGEIIVMDNKPNCHFSAEEIPYENIRIIDNTTEQIVNYTDIRAAVTTVDSLADYGSAKHSKCIDYALSTLITTPMCLVSDSDVIYKTGVYHPYSMVRAGAIVSGEVGRTLPGTTMPAEFSHTISPRIFPCMCIINVDTLRKKNIRFYDPHRMMMLNGCGFNYDTGASFFADIISQKLPYVQIRMSDYVNHLASGSYISQNWMSFIRANASFLSI